MTVLTLPDRCVVVLVGAAGAGKSTLAARLFRPAEVLSSDAYRARIAGDERDQRASGAAFRAIAATLERRLIRGERAVIDATNLQRRERRPWIEAARRHRVPTVAIVLDLPPAVVRAQGTRRTRLVDAAVVDRHLAAMRRTGAPQALRDEGFDIVVSVRTPEEAAALESRPYAGSSLPSGSSDA